MHILIVSTYAPPEIGAAPKRLIAHARRWASSGHRVTVVTNIPHSPQAHFFKGYQNTLVRREVRQGVIFLRGFTVPAGKRSSALRRLISSCISVFTHAVLALLVEKPDVIVATAPTLTGLSAYLASVVRRIPFVYEMRDPWIAVAHERQRGVVAPVMRMARAYEKFIAQRADDVVVVTHTMAQEIRKLYDLTTLPEVMPNGVEESHDFSSDVCRRVGGDRELLLGYFGNMGQQYDLACLVDVAAAAEAEKLPVLFEIRGEGSQKMEVRREIDAQSLSNVSLHDPISEPARMYRHIARCDLVFIPLRSEAIYRMYLPMKLLDALSCATPVFLVGRGEAAEVIENAGAGFCISTCDRSDILRMIRELVRDRGQLEEMGERGRGFVQLNYHRSRIAEAYEDLLVEIAEG